MVREDEAERMRAAGLGGEEADFGGGMSLLELLDNRIEELQRRGG